MMREKHANAPAVPDRWNIFGHGAAQHSKVPWQQLWN
jgi:hypothetical protein